MAFRISLEQFYNSSARLTSLEPPGFPLRPKVNWSQRNKFALRIQDATVASK